MIPYKVKKVIHIQSLYLQFPVGGDVNSALLGCDYVSCRLLKEFSEEQWQYCGYQHFRGILQDYALQPSRVQLTLLVFLLI
jgi:hypothetical protein